MVLAQNDARLLLAIARTFVKLGGLNEALALYRRAAHLDPELVEAHEGVGSLLLQLGDTHAAALTLRVALGRHPEAPRLHLALADALGKSNRVKEALRHAKRARELLPESTEPRRLLVQLYDQLGASDEHIQALQELLKHEPDDIDVASALGLKLALAGRREEATRVLADAVQKAPPRSDVMLRLGTALFETRALALAVKCLREALRVQPDLSAAHATLGRALAAAGAIDEALSALKNAASLDPQNAKTLQLLGTTLRSAGRIREAASVLVRASALAPDDDEIQETLGATLSALKTPRGPVPQAEMSPESSEGGFTGDLAIFSLPELLEFLLNQNASGMLIVRGTQGDGSFELHQGNLVGASFPGCRPLSELLVDQDLISQTDLKRSIVNQADVRRDAVVATVLVQNKLVDRAVLYEILSRQIQTALMTLVTWRDGAAVFRRQGRLAPEQTPEIVVDTRWALLEAMRKLDEQGRK